MQRLIDENDNLFGEHLWYNGEQKNTWGWQINCLVAFQSVPAPACH